jgi:hypothetical protein
MDRFSAVHRSIEGDNLSRMSRRDLLWHTGGGLGGIALSSLLNSDPLHADSSTLSGTGLHHSAKARRVIQLFMSGAASQCDLWDYKPRLAADHGQPWDPGEKVELFQSAPGHVMAAPWPWQAYGQSGKWLNECVAPLGEVIDRIAFVHNMVSKSNVHGPATFMQATGFVLPGFPSIGSWISYGLGRSTDELPTFVVLPDPRGYAPNGPRNWGAAFLPAEHQGTAIDPHARIPINDLFPPAAASFVSPESEQQTLEVLERLNRRHADQRAGDSRLEARIQSYELAARMQLSAPQVLDLSDEPQHILDLYGVECGDVPSDAPMNEGQETRYFGRNCLIARKLLERGVRFVQIWSGADNGFPRRNWDSHEDLKRDHWPLARGMSRGVAALIQDLAQRGLLDATLVLWTTEFGRMPCSQGSQGRDHNPFGFTNWLAGGGIQGGVTYGLSDEWSWRPAEPDRATYCYDIHATILHLLGIDHTRLTYRAGGIDRRLTDVHGRVLTELLA